MKMTLKNQMLVKIDKMKAEAEKLGYVPNTIEISKDELQKIINELFIFKPEQYTLVYKDRRHDSNKGGIPSSMSSVFLQHRADAVVDIIIANTATLMYNDIRFVVIEDLPVPETTEWV